MQPSQQNSEPSWDSLSDGDLENGSQLSISIDGEFDRTPSPSVDASTDLIHARSYQLEMFEESLKQNIIVAMDTGSGKTQVAILRVQYELNTTAKDKIIWFLAPNITLCSQQLEALQSQILDVQMKPLTGNDNCDMWSDQSTWDDFLRNVRVVVSTPQVLADALRHAFVCIHTISLLIFDEAHHCTGGAPYMKIMDWYRERKAGGRDMPHILGLTASPITRSDAETIETIEKNLDAICKSPRKHIDELRRHTRRPTMSWAHFGKPGRLQQTTSMLSLKTQLVQYDILQDPYIIRRQSSSTEKSEYELEQAIMKSKTPNLDRLKSLCRKTNMVCRELGPEAADYFISVSISQFLKSFQLNNYWFETWNLSEKQNLVEILKRVKIQDVPEIEAAGASMSFKVEILVKLLLEKRDGAKGVVFVKDRAVVFTLAHLLSSHPSLQEYYSVGLKVGDSNNTQKVREVGEWYQEGYSRGLEEFRSGELNLLIATNVLEEGIDVPACNLVVCFDEPTNLRSFIQRRGRARMENSEVILLIEEGSNKHERWEQLECEMKKLYNDQMRQVKEAVEREDSDEATMPPFRVKATGAMLEFDDAKSHLQNFCNRFCSRPFVFANPYYITREVSHDQPGQPQFRATVVLPLPIPPHIRRFESSCAWRSEKNATKDAAFKAFKTLYREKLVNDNLMPLQVTDLIDDKGTKEPMTLINQQWNLWTSNLMTVPTESHTYSRPIRVVDSNGHLLCQFKMNMSIPVPPIRSFKVYCDKSEEWNIEIGAISRNPEGICSQDETGALVRLAYGDILKDIKIPDALRFQSDDGTISTQQIGHRPIPALLEAESSSMFFVRDTEDKPYYFEKWFPKKPAPEHVENLASELQEGFENEPWLVLREWERQWSFLGPDSRHHDGSDAVVISSKHVLPASCCRLDSIHMKYVKFGGLIPYIQQKVELWFVVKELCSSILTAVDISDQSLVEIAIRDPSSLESKDHQRLRFLGNSLLNLYSAINVTAHHEFYPRGLLSGKKASITSHSTLCEAAIRSGLDKYIWMTSFSATARTPGAADSPIATDAGQSDTREVAIKTIAKVVQALIGAGFVDGGLGKALACIQTLVPKMPWVELDQARSILYATESSREQLSDRSDPVQDIIGYTFQKKAWLFQALTHPSFDAQSISSTVLCNDRLGFIGGAVLDYLVIRLMWKHEPCLTLGQMQMLKSACTNDDILGFIVMGLTASEEAIAVAKDTTATSSRRQVPLWKFMYYSSQKMVDLLRTTEEKYAEERGPIVEALKASQDYPWVLLAHMNPPEFLSDLFKSLIGAVWVDSGSLDICESVITKAGIIDHLRRMISDDVAVLHPRNRLGELVDQYTEEKPEYKVAERRNDRGKREWMCKVIVGGELIAEADQGVGKEHIWAKAAEAAYQVLKPRLMYEKNIQPDQASHMSEDLTKLKL